LSDRPIHVAVGTDAATNVCPVAGDYEGLTIALPPDVESRREIAGLADQIGQAMDFRPRENLCEAPAHGGSMAEAGT
jgi:hypothetical protein